MRLSNVKTREEIGFDYVIHSLNLITPFGKKILKDLEPFNIGEENKLKEELKKIKDLLKVVIERPKEAESLLEALMNVKDCYFSIERSVSNVLTVVELFEIKSLLLTMKEIKEIEEKLKEYIPKNLMLEDTVEVLDLLDPRKDRINTFYIYDEFSSKVGEIRTQKRKIELEVRKIQKKIKKLIQDKYGIILTPKFDYTVSKSNAKLVETVKSLPEMIIGDQDYMSITFTLKPTEETDKKIKLMDELDKELNEEELKIRETLSQNIAKNAEILKKNCKIIGNLDFTLSKAIYAKNHNCNMPTISENHIISFRNGRHLKVEDILINKGGTYCPVSIDLRNGVSCITGANMGGKTVSLKLVGLVALLTQYGFFVPCESADVGLSQYVHILIGDSQSIERGLSSFGSEMEELKEMLDYSKENSLLLIDEIASGTNPIEGLALSQSLIQYLKEKQYITLITTHFDRVTEVENIKNMQVTGLANVDFIKLEREIKYANRKERISIISKYMDYRLEVVKHKNEIPKDALNIAKMLGVYEEIIENAKKMLKVEAFKTGGKYDKEQIKS